ncbi:MAG: SUMF1/EgtB/PvdO family nonheme iron enzyme, partial [Victivallales bacterium]|nr:SUMF1/EgtB/PvdO family nonheme iron enzyme [Victivallales bacterium]
VESIEEQARSYPGDISYAGMAIASRSRLKAYFNLIDNELATEPTVLAARRMFWSKQIAYTMGVVTDQSLELLPIARGQVVSALPCYALAIGSSEEPVLIKEIFADVRAVMDSNVALSRFLPFVETPSFKGVSVLSDARANRYLQGVLDGLGFGDAARLFSIGGKLELLVESSGGRRSEMVDFVLVPLGLGEMGVSCPFYLATAEVTKQQMRCYKESVRDLDEGKGFRFKRISGNGPYADGTIDEAVHFCNWLSRYAGLDELYSLSDTGEWLVDLRRDGYRLPFDREWEYAARLGFDFAVEEGRTSWNSMRSALEGNNDLVWYYEKKLAGPRGNDHANTYPLGLVDMCGNVEEVCMKKSAGDMDAEGEVAVNFVAQGGGINSRSLEKVMPWSSEQARCGAAEYGFRVIRSLPVQDFNR